MKIKQINIALMVIAFVVLAFTGVVKFLGLYGYDIMSGYYLNLIHDWSGIILVIFIIIHLIIKRKYFAGLIAFNRKFLGMRLGAWYLIIFALLFGIIVLLYVQNLDYSKQKVEQLAKSEVREYQGEELSSVNDLQETSIKGIQNIDVNDYELEITGLVEKPNSFTYDEILELQQYSKVVEINCVTGWNAKILWEGILMKDLFAEVQVKPEAKVAIFPAQDGFETSLPLDYINDKDIIMAAKINNVVIPPEKGFPFQLVAEQKWGYKWVKWITNIELSDNIDFRGTYESEGYNNEANIDGPKRETNN